MKIALGDLRHATLGRHSVLMPVGIGYIASHLLARMGKSLEVRLFNDPDKLLDDIDSWKPDVIGLSNYCWNAELSRVIFRHAKKKKPNVVCISGGPEFPTDSAEIEAYMRRRDEIDFYIYREGERPFARIIEQLRDGTDMHDLKSTPQDGAISISPATNTLVYGNPIPRLIDLDEIPSPYLTGIMDQWFDGNHAPTIETTRGCPYSCAYCVAGGNDFNKISFFSAERINAELRYIAAKIGADKNIMLQLCDTNFGMYERDAEIARCIKQVQDEFGWPTAFDVTTGKSHYDRILDIASLLKNSFQISGSVQTLNPETAKVVKRKNLPVDKYLELLDELKKRKHRTTVELIIPMPEESQDSFMNGVKILVDAGIERVTPYTTMLLKGTGLASKECREKYQMQTMFRILPRQFGEYRGEKCFEVEEVCIGTNSMPFNDYLECRGFAFVTAVFSSGLYDVLRLHVTELGINTFEYFKLLWQEMRSSKTPISEVYRRYINETIDELWESPEAIYEFYGRDENYEKLIKGILGDNLIRKYTNEVFLDHCIESFDLAYSAIKTLVGDRMNPDEKESIEAVEKWVKITRDMGDIFRNDTEQEIDETLNLQYDVLGWYSANSKEKRLVNYKTDTSYKILKNSERLAMITKEARKLYGDDLHYRIGKLLITWSIKEFWRKTLPISEKTPTV